MSLETLAPRSTFHLHDEAGLDYVPRTLDHTGQAGPFGRSWNTAVRSLYRSGPCEENMADTPFCASLAYRSDSRDRDIGASLLLVLQFSAFSAAAIEVSEARVGGSRVKQPLSNDSPSFDRFVSSQVIASPPPE